MRNRPTSIGGIAVAWPRWDRGLRPRRRDALRAAAAAGAAVHGRVAGRGRPRRGRAEAGGRLRGSAQLLLGARLPPQLPRREERARHADRERAEQRLEHHQGRGLDAGRPRGEARKALARRPDREVPAAGRRRARRDHDPPAAHAELGSALRLDARAPRDPRRRGAVHARSPVRLRARHPLRVRPDHDHAARARDPGGRRTGPPGLRARAAVRADRHRAQLDLEARSRGQHEGLGRSLHRAVRPRPARPRDAEPGPLARRPAACGAST